MPFNSDRRFLFVVLSLSLFHSTHAQSPSQPLASPSAPSSAVKELAAALATANSEEEQERLLAREKLLMNSSLLGALKDLIRSFTNKGDSAQALKTAQIAVRLAERIGDRPGLSDALSDLGSIYYRQYRFDQALNSLEKSLAMYEESGDKRGMARALQLLGYTYRGQSQFDRALESFNRSLALSEECGDRKLTASILIDVGRAHSLLGQYELELEYLEKSRILSEELNDKALLDIVLNNTAIYYIDQGRYTLALECLQKSAKILEDFADANKLSLALRLNNIGIIYKRQGRYDQALAYYQESLKTLEEFGDKGRMAEAQNNIGVVYKWQGLYEQSLEWLGKSLRNFEEVKYTAGVATSLNNIGDSHRRMGRFDQALAALQKSLQLREQLKDSSGITLTLNNLSRLYQDLGEYSKMLEVGRRAAGLARESNDPEGLWNAQNGIGISMRALGQPEMARQSFLEAIATLESLREQVAGGAQQQQSFLENKLSPWLGMIDLLVSQGQSAEALSFAEQSKARVLIDTLQMGRASLHKSLSPEEQQLEERKRLHLVSLNSKLTGELRLDKPNPSLVAELKAEIARERLEFESLETGLYVAHPELKVFRGKSSTIKMEELGGLLPDAASAALEYVVAEDKTFLFAITKAAGKPGAEVHVYTLPIKRNELSLKTEAFRRQLAERDLGFRASAAKIYDLLLKPAEAQIKGKTRLILAPDNCLWDLPFQALLVNGGRFLIERAAISYTPSLTALREIGQRRKNQKSGAASPVLLALGNPSDGKQPTVHATENQRKESLAPLPEAEQEVKALSRIYGATQSKIFIGPEARENRVKNEAGNATIIHFATHGIVNNALPMYSHLVLAQGGSDEDGLLEAWELMRLDLRADLVVLSACETARGRFGAGEGMIGLTWALFVAGAPTTVVSQWKVESASTRDLMLSFHQHLQSPQLPMKSSAKMKISKDEALRRSVMRLMRTPETSHPFYWAGFVLMGDAR